MLVELSMVEQRYDAVREVLDGATVTDVATAMALTGEPFIAGSCATPTTAWPPLPSAARSPIAALTRCRQRSRPASSRCAEAIPGGVHARSSTSSAASSSGHRRARRSTAASCDIG